MNRLLSRILAGAAGGLVVYAGLLIWSFHALHQSWWTSGTLWLALGGSGLLAWVAWRGSMKARFRWVLLLLLFLGLEVVLESLAWAGLLPVVNTKVRTPYGRVYWNAEGHGNAIRNRYGWHYPEFNFQAARRIAVIGDSQVEALEVCRGCNQAGRLQGLLQAQSPDSAVFGLGNHGTAPAYYIEVLDYARRHVRPQEAVIIFTLGSDISESEPALNPQAQAGQYVYYDASPAGELVLVPGCEGALDQFRRSLELSHAPLALSLPYTINSHLMSLQMLRSARDSLETRRRLAALAAREKSLDEKARAELSRIGFNAAPFALEPGAPVRHAMTVVAAELRRCQEMCATNGIKLRLVLVPAFPKAFYDSQHGKDWTMQIGQYDYLKPERELVEFARTNGISVLPMGDYIRRQGLGVEEIRSLYFAGGTGHFTEQGHRLCAKAIFETFYQRPAP